MSLYHKSFLFSIAIPQFAEEAPPTGDKTSYNAEKKKAFPSGGRWQPQADG